MTNKQKDQTQRLAVIEYQQTVLLPAVFGMLQLCSNIESTLEHEKSAAHDDFDSLWNRLTKLYDSIGKEEQ
jgi:hypothetical protein